MPLRKTGSQLCFEGDLAILVCNGHAQSRACRLLVVIVAGLTPIALT